MSAHLMIDVVRIRQIAAPIDAVWAVLADFAAISSWAANVDHSSLVVEPTDDDMIGVTRRVQVGRTVLLERIVVWQPHHSLAYDISGLPKVVRSVRNRWDLADAGDGRCSATLTSTIDTGPRPPQQLIARIVGRKLAKASDTMLAGLAGRAEGDFRD